MTFNEKEEKFIEELKDEIIKVGSDVEQKLFRMITDYREHRDLLKTDYRAHRDLLKTGAECLRAFRDLMFKVEFFTCITSGTVVKGSYISEQMVKKHIKDMEKKENEK